MKNIHLLYTDKPSRLFYLASNIHLEQGQLISPKNYQNIYITSDEKTVPGKGDWYLGHPLYTSIHRWHTDVSKIDGRDVWINKIILTTDQDLIKDGVWGIEDGFLEWFVKNPTCEYVELKGYAIILPGESCDCDNICGECEPKQERMDSEEDLDSFRKFMIQEQNFSKSCLDVFVKQNKNK